MRLLQFVICYMLFCCSGIYARSQDPAAPRFRVIAFYTARNDKAHISFLHEANRWFPEMAKQYHFQYDSTNDWNNLNADFLAGYQVVLFLDTRPDQPAQREAFQKYMENGGAWMGFHFSAFALTPSDYPQNWDWYHNTFLGSGSYVSNTWRPTSAVLRVEDPDHWTNKKYRMIYFNMGHNDIDYDHKTDRELSFTFANKMEDRLIINALLWLGSRK